MTTLLIDTSVLIKWFHRQGEAEVPASRAIRDAHQRGEIDARVLDLAVYELGNVLLTSLGWPASDVVAQLEDLVAICGTPLILGSAWYRDAAELGRIHGLTFYDAAWAAAARALRVPLVSADAKLIGAGLAESPTAVTGRLRLPTPAQSTADEEA